MAFATDVVAGFRLALQIYEYGFAEENKADVKYRNFRHEILNFRILLLRLDEALRGAHSRFLNRPALGRHPHDPSSEEFEDERKVIVGNFLGTLQECDALLKKNKQYRDRDANVLENLRVNMSRQEVQVEYLRRRLYMHSQKIRLVLDRLSLNLLTDLDANVADIRAIAEQNLQVSVEIRQELRKFRKSFLGHISGQSVPTASASEGSHAVSDSIAQRFQDSLLVNSPSGIENGIPLSQGFDALLLHFEQSSETTTDQTPEKYLSFLKARWLLERLKKSNEYRKARPGFYYKRAVNQVEQAIFARMIEPGDLIVFDESTLQDLPEIAFHVWPEPISPGAAAYSAALPDMTRGGEERIAKLDLAGDGLTETGSVTVFKSVDAKIRIVRQATPVSSPDKTVITPLKLQILEDKLIPRYAFPTLTTPCLELAIYSRNDEELFQFKSLPDLFEFQTSLMGYEVSHDQANIRCEFSNNVANLDCKGRVQLWQEPIVLPSLSPNGASGQSPSTSHRSRRSTTDTSHSRHDSVGASFAATSTINAAKDGWQADNAKTSFITIFTQLTDKKRKRFSAISIELEAGVYIDPGLCKCHRDPGCKSIALQNINKSSTPISMRVLNSDSDSEGQPNPTTFDIFPLRLPRHPEFSSRVSVKQTEYVLLKFSDVDEKNKFHQELQNRIDVRDQQLKNRHNFEKKLRNRQDHPQNPQHRNQSLSPDNTQMPSPWNRPAHSRNSSGVSSSITSPRHSGTEDTIAGPSTQSPVGLGLEVETRAKVKKKSSILRLIKQM